MRVEGGWKAGACGRAAHPTDGAARAAVLVGGPLPRPSPALPPLPPPPNWRIAAPDTPARTLLLGHARHLAARGAGRRKRRTGGGGQGGGHAAPKKGRAQARHCGLRVGVEGLGGEASVARELSRESEAQKTQPSLFVGFPSFSDALDTSMPRLRVRHAGVTSHVSDVNLAAPPEALRAALGLPPTAALSLDAYTRLPADTPLAEAGVRGGDLLYILGGEEAVELPVEAAPAPPLRRPRGPPPPPTAVVRAVAALPSTASPAAIAAIAAAAVAVEAGCVAEWETLTPLAPPQGWAPPTPLRLTYGGVPLVLRALAMGPACVVVAAGVESGAGASAARRPHPLAVQTPLAVPREINPTAPGASRLSTTAWVTLSDRVVAPAATAAAAAAGVNPPPSLLSLPFHVTQTHILPHLASRDLANLACAGSRPLWGAVTAADAVWRSRHAADHGTPPPSTAASPYTAYASAARAAAAVRRAAARPNSLGWGRCPPPAVAPRRLAPDARRPRGGGVWGGDYDRVAPAGWGGAGSSYGGGGQYGARGGLPLRGGRWQPPPY